MLSENRRNWKREYFQLLRKEKQYSYNRCGQQHEFERIRKCFEKFAQGKDGYRK